ncbi:hypothetical protein HN510_03000, partial [Candidatus Woesearchaeota archaeon]|nr:hypothetical protein [Candidatus Woesearchaeota archaeon]
MSNKTFVYISGTDSSVFSSQVISLVKEVKEYGYFSRVVLLTGLKKNQSTTEELERLMINGFEVLYFKLYPNYPFFSGTQTKELQTVLKGILVENTVIQLRGETYVSNVNRAICNFKFNNVKILTDIRGANKDELELYLKGVYNPFKYQLKMFQAKINILSAGQKSDYISCVSESLKKYVMEETNVEKEKISVCHCIANDSFIFSEEKRKEFRLKLDINDDEILCVFVTGGNGYYQNTKAIIENFSSLGVKVLNLSKAKIDGAINLFVPFSDVPGYLCASDIGIVWRNDAIVNNVA